MLLQEFKKMSWARLTKKLNRSRSVSTINNNNNNLNFEKIRTSPSISEETVNSITSVLSKGGLISEGIFNLVPSSNQWMKSLSHCFQKNWGWWFCSILLRMGPNWKCFLRLSHLQNHINRNIRRLPGSI